MTRADNNSIRIVDTPNEDDPPGDTRKTNNKGESSMTALILLRRFGRRFADFTAGIGEARANAHRFKVLSQLTDTQLAERGLKRKEIPQVVWNHSIHA
jgi:hypothetical protein